MNIKHFSSLLVLVVFAVFTAQGQDYDFRVLVNQGDNQVSNGADWTTLKTGAKLKSGQEIKIVENGYVGLVHSSGKVKDLKSAGTYNVKSLSSGMPTSSNNITQKYADFVLSKMSPEEKEANRRKYANVTGAVERGDDASSINLYLPTSVSVYNNNAVIRWDAVSDGATYQVKLKNIFEDVIMVTETTESSYQIDFDDPKIASAAVEDLVIVNVSLKSNDEIKSKDAAIERVKEDQKPEFAEELVAVKASLGDTESSLNELILAELYEENGFILDALTSYENSVKISPDVPFFQEAYQEFLVRNGMKK